MIQSETYIAIPPGETIKEQLDDRGMLQKEFALRMGMSEKHISRLINGDVQLTIPVAIKLESVLGLPTKFWIALETRYREKIEKANAENDLLEDEKILKNFPYAKMVTLGWIENAQTKTDKIIVLRKFFEVSKLSLLADSKLSNLACRRLKITEKSDNILLVFAQKAKLEARFVETKSINLQKLQKHLQEIRRMTSEPLDTFQKELQNFLCECGIALIFLPHITSSYLQGISFFSGKKIVIGITNRGQYSDKFWFTLFHELAHIVLGHLDLENGTTDKEEKCADNWAKDNLISPKSFNNFVRDKNFSKESILQFAISENISPSIIVGRMQKEGYLKFNQFNDLRIKF